jgi:hypothetical protein
VLSGRAVGWSPHWPAIAQQRQYVGTPGGSGFRV